MNSRRKGIVWELKLLKELQGIFPETLTSRNASRKADSCGCDYINTADLCVQVKATRAEINPFKLYEELKDRQKLPGCEEKEVVIVKVYQASQYRRQDYDIIVFLPLHSYLRYTFNKEKEDRFYIIKQMKSGWRARYFSEKYNGFTKVIPGTIHFYPEFFVALTFKEFVNVIKEFYKLWN